MIPGADPLQIFIGAGPRCRSPDQEEATGDDLFSAAALRTSWPLCPPVVVLLARWPFPALSRAIINCELNLARWAGQGEVGRGGAGSGGGAGRSVPVGAALKMKGGAEE